MSSYKYSLFGYHAIKQAEIAIDGITVLAGDNGCGKSTLSRWLYYIVNATTRYEELLFEDLKDQLEELTRQGKIVVRELGRGSNEFSGNTLTDLHNSMMILRYSEDNAPQVLMRLFAESMHQLGMGLNEYLSNSRSENRILRMKRYLNLDIENADDYRVAIDGYIERKMRDAEVLFSEYRQNVEKRPITRFFDLIHSHYEVRDKEPKRIQLAEDGVKLLRNDELGSLFSLDRAIYIDTPMALNSDSWRSESRFWLDLRWMMKGSPVKPSKEALKLLIRVRNILGGEVKVVDSVYQDKELRFVRKADNLDIRLEDAATGFKTFAYIQKLLENGYLNEHTLLLIDEPEAHLHPKWIFEFAHLLVLLHKELGVKVMVASHNPDMVAAIQKVALVENEIEYTHFYQTYRDTDSYQFEYRDLGGSINEIFRSFNIATSRIQEYGEEYKTVSE